MDNRINIIPQKPEINGHLPYIGLPVAIALYIYFTPFTAILIYNLVQGTYNDLGLTLCLIFGGCIATIMSSCIFIRVLRGMVWRHRYGHHYDRHDMVNCNRTT